MATQSSGDGLHMQRTAAAGKFFAVVDVVDSAHRSESYTNIAQDYSRHIIAWLRIDVQPDDWIEVHASGQIDQKGTTIMEVVQKLEAFVGPVGYEISEETGVNINGRTSDNISGQRDRHHEDFAAYGVLDIKEMNLPAPREILIAWCFRARDSDVSAVIPADCTRVIAKIYREFPAS